MANARPIHGFVAYRTFRHAGFRDSAPGIDLISWSSAQHKYRPAKEICTSFDVLFFNKQTTILKMMTAFFGSTTALNATGVKSTGMVRFHPAAVCVLFPSS